MVKNIFLLLLFTTLTIFGQKPNTVEDRIYTALDAFTANPNEENLNKLETFHKSIATALDVTSNKNTLLAYVVLNCNKAYYENQFGKTNQAISSYEKALEVFQKNKLTNYDIVEFCLKPLGNLYTIVGDYDNAESTIKQYFYLASNAKNQAQKLAAILNLSNVYQSSGRSLLAIELLEKTIQTERLSNIQKGILLNNLGNNYVWSYKHSNSSKPIPGIFNKIEKTYFTAIQLLQFEKSQSETLANCYRNLAALNLQWRKIELANSYFKKAKNYFSEIPNVSPQKRAKFKYEEANLLLEQKKYGEATEIISDVFKILIPNYSNRASILPNSKSLYAETILLDALDLQAVIFIEQNQPKKALQAYAHSFQIEDLFANLLVYENSKIISQIRIRNRTEKCLSIYDTLYQNENKIAYIEKAFQLAERTKSGVLRSYLSNKKTASREEKLQLEQLQNWNNTILKEQQKGDLANVSQINAALKNQNELMLSLKKIRSKNKSSSEENIDLKSLYLKLKKDNATLIEYFSGYNKMYSFTILDNTISLNSFSNAAETSVKIMQFIDYFNNANSITNDIAGYNHYGNSTYKLLKLPRNTIAENLIIIPDGILNFLPFEALITKESSTTNFAKMHYLLHDFKIGYTNSATFYLNEKPIQQQEKTVLGMFPIFEKTNYTLTYSKEELQSIKNNFKGKYFQNSTATFKNFKENAGSYSILHLSTHASSGDTETPASIKFYDQEILYSELYTLNINPDLVVLSACETGIGKLYKSEGAMSIARGFQFAGAQNLLFSLWKVNDYTTALFMDKFYHYIYNGNSYLEANHQSKLDFLADKNISNTKKSPYYWSAFVYYGALTNKTESTNYIFYGIGMLLLIGLFLYYNKLQK